MVVVGRNLKNHGRSWACPRWGAWVVGAVVLLLATSADAHRGVAFLHGTGEQTDALSSYWTEEFVDSVTADLASPDDVLVVNCDFGQFAWDEAAAGCLATQMVDFIEDRDISELVVITHSNGSNVLRWIMSNPTWDSRYPFIIDRIAWVDALAPSSLGTPLADAVIDGNVLEVALGELLGYDNNGVVMQQEANMAYLNAHWFLGTDGRPPLPKPFFAVVGTDVETELWDADSYCGGYDLNLGLEITQAWLDQCSDGFLNCASQEAAGTVWFRDVDMFGEPLSHSQSRRACLELDTVLRSDISSDAVVSASGIQWEVQ